MSNNSIITIAIPFFNAEKFLPEAIESVINQTYVDFKLLLVNDGSSDSSLEIANHYQKIDDRIQVYSDGENKNLGFRLNQIPYLVNTKYLVRMDADDIMHPQKIEKQLDILLKNPDIDVLGTNAYSINEANFVVGIRLDPNNTELISVDTFIHPTIMAETKWFINNPYDVLAERIEDLELWYRKCSTSNFKTMPEPLFFYREFGDKYYKKYFKGNKPMLYILRKHKFSYKLMKISLRYYLAGLYYYVNSILGTEGKLILKRNQVIVEPRKLNEYL